MASIPLSVLIEFDRLLLQIGVFPEFSGEEFENFLKVAETLRAEYDFGHTKEAKHLPQGETNIQGPTIRLFKPYDELNLDFKVRYISSI